LPWLLALRGRAEHRRGRSAWMRPTALWRLGLPEGRERVRASIPTFSSPEARAELEELLLEEP
ncbi:HEAT repeat domain-containing protein, partial [Pyxidicoccus sp. 3LG]